MLSSYSRNCGAGAAHLSGCAWQCQSCIAGDAVDFWYCRLQLVALAGTIATLHILGPRPHASA